MARTGDASGVDLVRRRAAGRKGLTPRRQTLWIGKDSREITVLHEDGMDSAPSKELIFCRGAHELWKPNSSSKTGAGEVGELLLLLTVRSGLNSHFRHCWIQGLKGHDRPLIPPCLSAQLLSPCDGLTPRLHLETR